MAKKDKKEIISHDYRKVVTPWGQKAYFRGNEQISEDLFISLTSGLDGIEHYENGKRITDFYVNSDNASGSESDVVVDNKNNNTAPIEVVVNNLEKAPSTSIKKKNKTSNMGVATNDVVNNNPGYDVDATNAMRERARIASGIREELINKYVIQNPYSVNPITGNLSEDVHNWAGSVGKVITDPSGVNRAIPYDLKKYNFPVASKSGERAVGSFANEFLSKSSPYDNKELVDYIDGLSHDDVASLKKELDFILSKTPEFKPRSYYTKAVEDIGTAAAAIVTNPIDIISSSTLNTGLLRDNDNNKATVEFNSSDIDNDMAKKNKKKYAVGGSYLAMLQGLSEINKQFGESTEDEFGNKSDFGAAVGGADPFRGVNILGEAIGDVRDQGFARSSFDQVKRGELTGMDKIGLGLISAGTGGATLDYLQNKNARQDSIDDALSMNTRASQVMPAQGIPTFIAQTGLDMSNIRQLSNNPMYKHAEMGIELGGSNGLIEAQAGESIDSDFVYSEDERLQVPVDSSKPNGKTTTPAGKANKIDKLYEGAKDFISKATLSREKKRLKNDALAAKENAFMNDVNKLITDYPDLAANLFGQAGGQPQSAMPQDGGMPMMDQSQQFRMGGKYRAQTGLDGTDGSFRISDSSDNSMDIYRNEDGFLTDIGYDGRRFTGDTPLDAFLNMNSNKGDYDYDVFSSNAAIDAINNPSIIGGKPSVIAPFGSYNTFGITPRTSQVAAPAGVAATSASSNNTPVITSNATSKNNNAVAENPLADGVDYSTATKDNASMFFSSPDEVGRFQRYAGIGIDNDPGSETAAALGTYGSSFFNPEYAQPRSADVTGLPDATIAGIRNEIMPLTDRDLPSLGDRPDYAKGLTHIGEDNTISRNESNYLQTDLKGQIPFYLAQGVGALYDIQRGMKGADPVNYQRVKPEAFVDNTSQMQAVQRNRDSAISQLTREVANSGVSPSEKRNILSSGLASIDKQASDKIAELSSIAQNANVGIRNQYGYAGPTNVQIAMNEAIARQQEEDIPENLISSGLGRLGTIAGVAGSDASANKAQNIVLAGLKSGRLFYNKRGELVINDGTPDGRSLT